LYSLLFNIYSTGLHSSCYIKKNNKARYPAVLGPAIGHVIGQINLRNKIIIIIIIQESVATIEELYRPATRRLGEGKL